MYLHVTVDGNTLCFQLLAIEHAHVERYTNTARLCSLLPLIAHSLHVGTRVLNFPSMIMNEFRQTKTCTCTGTRKMLVSEQKWSMKSTQAKHTQTKCTCLRTVVPDRPLMVLLCWWSIMYIGKTQQTYGGDHRNVRGGHNPVLRGHCSFTQQRAYVHMYMYIN